MKGSIQATTMIGLTFAQARQALLDDPATVLGKGSTVQGTCLATFSMDLDVDLGSGASVHQEVTVQIGAPGSTDESMLVLPMKWRASEREHLLPVFDGTLDLSEAPLGTQIRLGGTYTVPLGLLGRFGDGVLGRRLARLSIGALVERVAARLESEANARLGLDRPPHERRRIALREEQHAQIDLG